jgi:membrane protein implicated in regulation of membrane protease activity
MEWNAATLWWVIAGVLVVAELATGTFYLLMLALGAAAGAIAAHLGLGFNARLLSAAVVGSGAVAAWHLARRHKPLAAPASANRDVNLDIGQTVDVPAWDGEGRAQVSYRGATWSVRYTGNGTPQPGLFVICALDGNCLLVEPAPSSR